MVSFSRLCWLASVILLFSIEKPAQAELQERTHYGRLNTRVQFLGEHYKGGVYEGLLLGRDSSHTASTWDSELRLSVTPQILPPGGYEGANEMLENLNDITIWSSAGPSGPVAVLGFWLGSVFPGGRWDYKLRPGAKDVLLRRLLYENFGNFNYGATGRELGIPHRALKLAAGLVGNFRAYGGLHSYTYGDDPVDYHYSGLGMLYVDSGQYLSDYFTLVGDWADVEIAKLRGEDWQGLALERKLEFESARRPARNVVGELLERDIIRAHNAEELKARIERENRLDDLLRDAEERAPF